MALDEYDWILGGGEGPFPHLADPADDPWPALTALVLDRQYREHVGHAHLPEASPLMSIVPPPEWEDWFEEWRSFAVEAQMHDGYRGLDMESRPVEEQLTEAEQREQARAWRRRNTILALVVGLLFVAAVLVAGRKLAPSHTPNAT